MIFVLRMLKRVVKIIIFFYTICRKYVSLLKFGVECISEVNHAMQTRFTNRLFTGAAVAACAVAIIAGKPASAQTDAITSFNSNAFIFLGNYTEGYTFTLASASNVTQLGYFDLGADGLTDAHNVAIYDSTGTLLVSQSVTANQTATLGNTFNLGNGQTGAFRYVTLFNPLALQANTTYTIAGYSQNGTDGVATQASNLVTASGVTFGGGVYRFGDSTGIGSPAPNTPSDRGTAYFGPTFRFSPAQGTGAPEPGTLALLGTGLLSMGGIAIRRKKSAK